jgi:oligoribonuclease NrnB/cAMP/cGMP phosphodiesterase (DHH superfamily)
MDVDTATTTTAPLGRAQQTLVIAHGPCNDGYAAALAYWASLSAKEQHELQDHGGPYNGAGTFTPQKKEDNRCTPEYAERIFQSGCRNAFVFLQPSNNVDPELVRGRNVIMLDIALRNCIDMICDVAHTVLVIDHHKSEHAAVLAAAEKYRDRGHVRVIYDESQSGAMLAFKHFLPDRAAAAAASSSKGFFAYIQDRDLWQWRLPDSKLINASFECDDTFRSFPAMYDTFAELEGFPEMTLESRRTFGAGAVNQRNAYVERIASNAGLRTLRTTPNGDERAYTAIVANSSILLSETGDYMLHELVPALERATPGLRIDMAITWHYDQAAHEIACSVRANRPDIDLSVICRSIYGARTGGGHPKAAGFRIPGDSIGAVLTRT